MKTVHTLFSFNLNLQPPWLEVNKGDLRVIRLVAPRTKIDHGSLHVRRFIATSVSASVLDVDQSLVMQTHSQTGHKSKSLREKNKT